MAVTRRAKQEVRWLRDLWAIPRALVVRALLYALVVSVALGISLPGLLQGDLTMIAIWLAGPVLIGMNSGVSDDPETVKKRRRWGDQTDKPAAVLVLMLLASLLAAVLQMSSLRDWSFLYYMPVIYLAFAALALFVLVVQPLRRVKALAFGVDEAGVRMLLSHTSNYWPFALLGDTHIVKRRGVKRLILRDRSFRRVADLPLLGAAAEQRAEELQREIDAGIERAKHAGDDVPPELRRGARPLGAWLEAVRRASLRDGPAYRNHTLDESQLVETLDNVDAPAEARAAAAYALLSSPHERVRVEAAERIGPASPPFVSVAAHLAGGEALPDDTLEGLDAIDRGEVEELVKQRVE